jgi:hypothetical protein
MVSKIKSYPRLQKMVRISYLVCLFHGASYNEAGERESDYTKKISTIKTLVSLVNKWFLPDNRFGYEEFLMRTWKKYKK